MKITTTLEVSKQEKNIIYSALQAYTDYLAKVLSETSEGGFKPTISDLLTETNRLLSEMSQTM